MKLQFDKATEMFCVLLEAGDEFGAVMDACREAGAINEQGQVYVKRADGGHRELLQPRELEQRMAALAATYHAPHCARHARPELNVGRPDSYRCTCRSYGDWKVRSKPKP